MSAEGTKIKIYISSVWADGINRTVDYTTDVSSLPSSFNHPYNDGRDATLAFTVRSDGLTFQQIVNGNGRSGNASWPDLTSGTYTLNLYFNYSTYNYPANVVVDFF